MSSNDFLGEKPQCSGLKLPPSANARAPRNEEEEGKGEGNLKGKITGFVHQPPPRHGVFPALQTKGDARLQPGKEPKGSGEGCETPARAREASAQLP